MVAVASPSLTKLRRRARLSPNWARSFGWVILAGARRVDRGEPDQGPGPVLLGLLTGVNNGTLYALIALGYTMVYGIIELINFAHGDLFMLGTVIAANVFSNWLGLKIDRAVRVCSACCCRWSSPWPRARSSTSAPRSSPTGGCATRPSWRR